MSDLTDMLENAPNEDDLHSAAENSDKELTQEAADELATKVLDFMEEVCPDPVFHKYISMLIINRMVDWHRNVAFRQLENGNKESMGAWMRDSGKFQAIMGILLSISVGPDDFTCPDE